MSYLDHFKHQGGVLVAPTLQIYAAEHCNKKCDFCTTSAPTRAVHHGVAEDFARYINVLYDNKVRFHDINIAGGEPFANRSLEKFVQTLRANIKYEVPFYVTSNGFWLDSAERYPTGLQPGDLVSISRYPDIVFRHGGLKRYETLIERLRRERPEAYHTTESYFFREWTFTDEPVYGMPDDCDLAVNLTISETGLLYRCCVVPGSSASKKMTAAFSTRAAALQFDLNAIPSVEALHAWIVSPLPDACGYCTAHHDTAYYPVRDIDSEFHLFDLSNGRNREILECGFSWAEAIGVWTEGATAVMTLPPLTTADAAAPWVQLTFRVQPHINFRVPRLAITIDSPGHDWEDQWTFPGPDQRSFGEQGNFKVLFVPRRIACGDQPFRLRFSIVSPHSPYDAGLSADRRLLGLFFEHVLADLP